jgi:hypothetical protein
MRLQGNFAQSKQNLDFVASRCMQVVTEHFLTDNALSSEITRQPGQLFFSRKNAIQVPQFMPQGAICFLSKILECLTSYYNSAIMFVCIINVL